MWWATFRLIGSAREPTRFWFRSMVSSVLLLHPRWCYSSLLKKKAPSPAPMHSIIEITIKITNQSLKDMRLTAEIEINENENFVCLEKKIEIGSELKMFLFDSLYLSLRFLSILSTSSPLSIGSLFRSARALSLSRTFYALVSGGWLTEWKWSRDLKAKSTTMFGASFLAFEEGLYSVPTMRLKDVFTGRTFVPKHPCRISIV